MRRSYEFSRRCVSCFNINSYFLSIFLTSSSSSSFINKWYCMIEKQVVTPDKVFFNLIVNNNTRHFQGIITKFDPFVERSQAPKEYTEYVCPDRYESGKILIPSHEWESSLIKLPHMVKDWLSEINARKSICSLPLCIMSSRPFIFREITIAFRSLLRSNKALNLNDIYQPHAHNAQCLI